MAHGTRQGSGVSNVQEAGPPRAPPQTRRSSCTRAARLCAMTDAGNDMRPQDYGGAVVIGDDVQANFTRCTFARNGRGLCADQDVSLVPPSPEACFARSCTCTVSAASEDALHVARHSLSVHCGGSPSRRKQPRQRPACWLGQGCPHELESQADS